MATKRVRKIVHIHPDKCDGCGLCVPSCAEGAIEIVDGKAVLAADNLCDGIGNCLGVCPQDAITIEERPADAFDEQAVTAHRESAPPRACPGVMARKLQAPCDAAAPVAGQRPSRLANWPVQLTLLPESGPIWDDADVLMAADCVAYALPDVHERLMAGRTVAIACPKLDDASAYVDKLARIFAGNRIRSVTVARMSVPCCQIDRIVDQAMAQAGADVPVSVVTIDPGGKTAGQPAA